MTAELEEDMDQIAAGKTSKDEVLRISREMLHGTTTELEEKREDLAKQIWSGMDEDKFLGPCKVCEEAGRKHEDGSPNRLRIIELKGGKRMYGCEGWNRDDPESPDSCQVSGPLPGRGYDLWRLEERCSICGEMPRLTVKGFRGRPWKLCLNDDCPSMVEMREKREERKRAQEAKKAAAKAAGANDDGSDGCSPKRQRPPAPQALTADRAPKAGSPLDRRSRHRACSSRSRGSTARGRRPRPRSCAMPWARTRSCSASPAAPRPVSGSATLLKDAELELDPRAELLLFCAARAELCASVIRPALEAGRSVICDRFVDSTAAYQGAARGLGVELVEGLNEIATAGCRPDLTLLLRIDPAGAEARGQQRLAAGGEDGSDRFEGEGIGFQRAVAAAYDELAARHPERIKVIDAEGSPGEVHERVMAAVGELAR